MLVGAKNSPRFKCCFYTNALFEKINPSCYYGKNDGAPLGFENALVLPPWLDKEGWLIQAQSDIKLMGPLKMSVLCYACLVKNLKDFTWIFSFLFFFMIFLKLFWSLKIGLGPTRLSPIRLGWVDLDLGLTELSPKFEFSNHVCTCNTFCSYTWCFWSSKSTLMNHRRRHH